jgi:hypothetical protein
VRLLGQKAKVWASSTLKAKDPRRYSVRNTFDGKPETAWVEGAAGMGYDESITIEFPQPASLSGFWLVPGYAKSLEVFLQNLAPERLVLSTGLPEEPAQLSPLADGQFHQRSSLPPAAFSQVAGKGGRMYPEARATP